MQERMYETTPDGRWGYVEDGIFREVDRPQEDPEFNSPPISWLGWVGIAVGAVVLYVVFRYATSDAEGLRALLPHLW